MKNRWRQLAVLLVFLALPLQGMAATIHALSCLSDGNGQHAAQAHVHDRGPHGSSHDHDGDTGKSDSAHFCCKLVASGMLVVPTAALPAEPPTFESPISLLATLFIPDRPQRPPLA
jgi:hypothetical protein